jgi:hypothetical protein
MRTTSVCEIMGSPFVIRRKNAWLSVFVPALVRP